MPRGASQPRPLRMLNTVDKMATCTPVREFEDQGGQPSSLGRTTLFSTSMYLAGRDVHDYGLKPSSKFSPLSTCTIIDLQHLWYTILHHHAPILKGPQDLFNAHECSLISPPPPEKEFFFCRVWPLASHASLVSPINCRGRTGRTYVQSHF